MATGFRNLTAYKKAFALACNYIPKEIFDDFNKRSAEIGRLLNHNPAFKLRTVDC